jgi:hypothetical protein
LVGSSKPDFVKGSLTKGQCMGKTDVLGRTNFRLFIDMVKLVSEPEPHARPKISIPHDLCGHGTDPMGWKKLANLSHFKAHNIHLIPEKTRNNHIYRMTWEGFCGSGG